MSSIIESEIERVIGNLAAHVPHYGYIIVKEQVELAQADGQSIEYRTMGARGITIAFDAEDDPTITPSALKPFVSQAYERLAQGGIDGELFLDVAITKAGPPTVIEVKSLINGTIKHPEVLGSGLARWIEAV